MEEYLREQKLKLLHTDGTTKIAVILGNEACDLDSVVSSLVFAYFIYKSKEIADIVVPVLNVKRQDLFLRTEVIFFLEKTKIPIVELICTDEIDLQALNDEGRLKLIMVDHNALSNKQSNLQSSVIQIIDHHKISDAHQLEKYECVIENVGSCCTLVAEEILRSSELMNADIALLLYGTILLDTVCLQESAKRTTEKDKEIVTKLETYIEGTCKEEVFNELQKAKFDVSNLTPEQLLKKDTKYISYESLSVAISSLPMLLENIIQQEEFISVLSHKALRKDLSFIVVLGSQVVEDNSSIRRQIAIFHKCQQSLEKVSNYLLSLQNPSLNLQPLPLCCKYVHLFEQRNSALSRKFILPAVQDYLKLVHSGCQDSIDSNMKCTNKNNLNLNPLNLSEENNSNDVIQYRIESLDFPDSPTHRSLHEIALTKTPTCDKTEGKDSEDKSQSESEDLDIGIDSMSANEKQKTTINCTLLEEDDQRSLSSLSNRSNLDYYSQSEDIILDDGDGETLDEVDMYSSLGSDRIPEMSAAEELEEERSWKSCVVNGEDRQIDMRAIEPYRKVISHGGYEESTCNAIILFSACYLPSRNIEDYDYVMDNLFLYVVVTLDELVTEDYVLIYLHGATESSSMPSFSWLKRCYQMIDRRLRKNLKKLYLVHPTFWLKTIVIMTRPFISAKFSRKLQFIYSLRELSSYVPLEHINIPEKVKNFDKDLYPDVGFHLQ